MFIPPSIFCMRQWIRTSLAQNTSILVLICWTTGARQQEAKLWEENDAWPWIWIYLKLVETNISSEERTAPRLLPLIYVQSPGAMSRHKSPMVCIQRLRLLCSQVLGVQKLFGDAVLFLFGVSFVAYNALGQHQVSTNVRTTPRYCKERNLVNIVGYVYIYIPLHLFPPWIILNIPSNSICKSPFTSQLVWYSAGWQALYPYTPTSYRPDKVLPTVEAAPAPREQLGCRSKRQGVNHSLQPTIHCTCLYSNQCWLLMRVLKVQT